MAEPFLGEIRMFTCQFAPKGWAFCNGSLLAINQNQALFSLLGTTYGGNGTTTFALPDLRGRIPVHIGNQVALGESAGEESHMLGVAEMPEHGHSVSAYSQQGSYRDVGEHIWADFENGYALSPNNHMSSGALSITGNGAAHSNMQPFNVVNYCIAIMGIFPSRN